MAIAYVARVASRTGTTTVTSFSMTTTASIPAGDLIVVSVGVANTGDTNNLSSVTDSAGNTYVSGGFTVDPGQNTLCAVWYCANCLALASGSTVTVTLTASVLTFGQFQGAAVDDISGAATATPVDAHTGHNSQVGTTWDTNSATTTNANDLLWVASAVNQGHPLAVVNADCVPTSGWTTQTVLTAGNSDLATAFQVVSATGTDKGGGTAAGGNNGISAVIVAFKAAAGGGPTTVTLTDAGAGTDALSSLNVAASLVDAGTGVDTLASLGATLPLADNGAGTDNLASLTVTFTLTDAVTGADSLSVNTGGGSTPITFTESGAGADGLSVQASVPLTDSGAGAQTFNLAPVLITLSDAATGADVLAVTATTALADSGVGAQTLVALSVAVSLADAGMAGETIAFAPISVALAESGTGANTLNVLGATVPGLCTVSDALVALVTLSDSAVGVVTLADVAVGLCVVSDSPAEVN